MNVVFHLYFPNADGARRAAADLKGDGYEVETRPSADGVEWLAFASRTVDDKAFDAAGQRMEELARAHGGRYDGYEEDA